MMEIVVKIIIQIKLNGVKELVNQQFLHKLMIIVGKTKNKLTDCVVRLFFIIKFFIKNKLLYYYNKYNNYNIICFNNSNMFMLL